MCAMMKGLEPEWCNPSKNYGQMGYPHSGSKPFIICTHATVLPGKTELPDAEESPVKKERSQVQEEMVALFGSERKKRAFAAFKKNRVGDEALETALASAVTHVDSSATSREETAGDGRHTPPLIGHTFVNRTPFVSNVYTYTPEMRIPQ